MLAPLIDVIAHEISPQGAEKIKVSVGAEYSFSLTVNGSFFARIACSGIDMEELAMGHLISCGLLKRREQLLSIKADYKKKEISAVLKDFKGPDPAGKILTSSGGSAPDRAPESAVRAFPGRVRHSCVTEAMEKFLTSSDMHRASKGVHSAALTDVSGKNIFFYDEIGRHNALDKIIGAAFLNDVPLQDKMILSSGRLAGDIVRKAAAGGAPVLISKASPTSAGVENAIKYGIVLIGKVRGNKMCVFSGMEYVDI